MSHLSYFHKKCGQPVNLNVSEAYLVEGAFSTSDGFLSVISLALEFRGRKTEKFPATFNCCKCGESVAPTELTSSCTRCFGNKSVEELFKVNEYPGVYCQGCIDELSTELKMVVEEMMVKPLLASLSTFKITK